MKTKRKEELKGFVEEVMVEFKENNELNRAIAGIVRCTAMIVAEKADKTMIERACSAYCEICDTKECGGTGECSWVERFRKQLED